MGMTNSITGSCGGGGGGSLYHASLLTILLVGLYCLLQTLLACRMSTTLENFVVSHPTVSLSHAEYKLHFHLGRAVNIYSSPTQRLRFFVENAGFPYRFIVVGQLTSFKIVEDSVCLTHFSGMQC